MFTCTVCMCNGIYPRSVELALSKQIHPILMKANQAQVIDGMSTSNLWFQQSPTYRHGLKINYTSHFSALKLTFSLSYHDASSSLERGLN